MTITRRLAALTPLAALALAACSGGSDEEPPVEANIVEAPIVNDMGFANMVEPIAPPTATPSATPTPAEDPVAEEAQVQDDADASGMTARVNRDDNPAANETQPADVSENK
jgi:hypothetical protein